ncbi:hypothetical protein [Alysiella filiformis]|uniref:hypothetical protein n=1 Tax=Alysiella filiformis TaxID=194196 RepID=UPI0015CE7A12|nr:hypothetical protein [Alysiella filiformis]
MPTNLPSLPMGESWREGLLSSIPSPQPSPTGRGSKVTSIYQSLLYRNRVI